MPIALKTAPMPRRRVSLTPLIDVVFILLVFFMLETTFLSEGGIELTGVQPGSGAAAGSRLTVELFDARTVWVNGRRYSGAEWQAAVPTPGEVDAAELRSAEDVPVSRLVEVLDSLAVLGHDAVAIGRVRGLEP